MDVGLLFQKIGLAGTANAVSPSSLLLVGGEMRLPENGLTVVEGCGKGRRSDRELTSTLRRLHHCLPTPPMCLSFPLSFPHSHPSLPLSLFPRALPSSPTHARGV